MQANPYQTPQASECSHCARTLIGWALIKDSLLLFVVGLITSIVGVPLLFMFFVFIQIALQLFGFPQG